MTKFTLVIMPNGKALMTTEERIPDAQLHDLSAVWRRWKESNQDVLFMSGVKVRLVEDIELDLAEGTTMGDKPKETLADDEGKIDVSIKKEDVDQAGKDAGLTKEGVKNDKDTPEPTLMENK